MNNEEAKLIDETVTDVLPIEAEELEKTLDFNWKIFLSTDGKQTVEISGTGKDGSIEAMKWAKSVYEKLLTVYGPKQNFNGQDKRQLTSQNDVIAASSELANTDEKRFCAQHGVEMIRSKNLNQWGKYSYFHTSETEICFGKGYQLKKQQ